MKTPRHLPRRPDSGFSLFFTWTTLVTVAAGLLFPVEVASGATPSVQFNRDIRPILADNCYACHGPDAGARKGKLRLDTREGMFDATRTEPAIVPGDLAKSELWARVITTDPDDIMPPPDSNKTLKPEQKEKLKEWILSGAQWQSHWSYIKPTRPQSPPESQLQTAETTFKIRNPIDQLVLAKLNSLGLSPAPEADRRTLARRLSLDLTGLPPQPEVVEAFLNDSSAGAYNTLVEKLMDSPHWGEHRARYWLDAARYADTHGLHFDNYREMWPYRDWVIKAFNENMPFDRFTLEQIAGDLLNDPTLDQQTATGFHRCNMTTNEGGTIDEENEANYANDRVTTTAWVWLGTTANCSTCHDHKFDPVTMKDFYSMAAFFRNSTQPPKDGNSADSRPSIRVPQTPEDKARWNALPNEIAAAKQQIESHKTQATAAFNTWLETAKPADLNDQISSSKLSVHFPLVQGQGQSFPSGAGTVEQVQIPDNPEWQDGELGKALVLKAAATLNLGNQGDFEKDTAFSYGCWVRVSAIGKHAGILARMDPAQEFRGWDLYQNDQRLSVHLVHKWPGDAIKVTTRDNTLKAKTWQHVFVSYDGSGKAAGVTLYIDGVPVPTKTEQDSLQGSIRTGVPLRVGQRNTDHVLERGRVQDVRIYTRALNGGEVSGLAKAVRAQSFLKLAGEDRNPEARKATFDYWLTSLDKPYADLLAQLNSLNSEYAAIKDRSPLTHIFQEKANSTPTARILMRGQYNQPGEEVTANTIAALHPMPKDAPKNRLGLAQWLAAPDNPLTSRVTVNRFWAEVFGIGIVATAEDFGAAGEPPVNQDLLDWLAVEFQESGWDVKHLFKLIVSSSTYRQSAAVTPEKLQKDPQNRFLSRGPRFRMDAEMLRDYALAASGLLVRKIGGPSVKPYQPDGVWAAVAMPESNTKKYQRDSGEGLYRRSLYTFWKRAAPPATMDLFNAPSRETCTVRRERTNTPLQALATLNSPQFIEAARHLAERALTQAGANSTDPLDIMARLLLARPLNNPERAIVAQTQTEMTSYYSQNPDDAKVLLSVGESRPSDTLPAPQLAALTLVANQLMNLDEVVNK